MATLAEEYLTFDNSEGLIDAKLYDMIIDCFNKSYKAICDFYNFGELSKTSIVPAPDYDGVAATYSHEAKVIMSTKYYANHKLDADSLTHEWVHVAQNYDNYNPGWLTEGLADYGREKFGIYNKEAGWSLPKYNEKQNYTDAYRVTAAFLIWVEDNVCPNIAKTMNDKIKRGEYKDECWKELTGKTVEELWQMYADANKATA